MKLIWISLMMIQTNRLAYSQDCKDVINLKIF